VHNVFFFFEFAIKLVLVEMKLLSRVYRALNYSAQYGSKRQTHSLT